jgi:hypothetical protein
MCVLFVKKMLSETRVLTPASLENIRLAAEVRVATVQALNSQTK